MSRTIQKIPDIVAIKKQAFKDGKPIYGGFELTSRCNLDCKMCYVHNQDVRAALQSELSTEQWITLMDRGYEAGMLFALLTGGECMLRKDFRELYLHLYNKGVIMSVNTNGTLIRDDDVQFFADHRPERIQISLYGSCDDGYESVTGHRQFHAVEHALEALTEAKLDVEIAITPSTYMYDDIENIFKFVHSHGYANTLNDSLFAPRDGSDNGDCFLTAEQQLEIIRMRRRVRGRPAPVPPECPAPRPCGNCTEAPLGVECNAGTCRFTITHKGQMVPCFSIPEYSIDALHTPFDECWSYIHAKMASVKLPVECVGCVYKKKCPYCVVIRSDGFGSGHCNPDCCALAVSKFESGLIRIKNANTD